LGQIIDGKWVKKSIVTSDESGQYDRIPRSFLDTISPDHPKYQPESGRYHLYVSYACPWAHRTLLFRAFKDLQDHISVAVVSPDMLDMGWTFSTQFSGTTGDTLYGKEYLFEIYQKAQSDVTTSCTVPILWDKKTESIVNNESSQIIRIFNQAFDDITGNQLNFYPDHLADEIDQINEEIYHKVNNGVYRAGFAKNQEAYDKAVTELFATLDKLDTHLQKHPYLVGGVLTEADLRLLPTLLRFDAVYFGHFKCNLRQIKEYQGLSQYVSSLFEHPQVQETTFMDHIQRHYYYSHEFLNPQRIVPKGPLDLGFTIGS
jgi:glutathionyl-hydroquinone reductase